MEVLRTKHTEARAPKSPSLDSYLDRPPGLVPVDITDNTLTEVAWKLLGRGRARRDRLGQLGSLATEFLGG